MKSRFDDLTVFAEGEDPMAGMGNLADVMLVLACGLMLALVINWNVDIAPRDGEETRADEIREMEFAGDGGESLDAAEFEKIDGVVYRDPDTGKLYLVENGGN
jgi:hypothetical protein